MWRLLALAMAVTVSGRPSLGRERDGAQIWGQLREMCRIAETEGKASESSEAKRAWIQTSAKRLASAHDRETIESLFWTANERDISTLAGWLSAWMIAEIADPNDQYGFRASIDTRSWPRANWHGIAIAAIDVYHDDRAREFLMQCLRKDDVEREDDVEGAMHAYFLWFPLHDYAAGLLRTYDSPIVREELERLRDAKSKDHNVFRAEQQRFKSPGLHHWRTLLLAGDIERIDAALSSLRYAERLEGTDERKLYNDFERRLWRGYALARITVRTQRSHCLSAGALLTENWQVGYEPFLLRVIRTPESTRCESNVAIYHAYLLSPDGERELQALADSDSPRANYARSGLELARQERELRAQIRARD